MRVLVATAMYPSASRPTYGAFVHSQVEALRKAGVDVVVYRVEGRLQKWAYVAALYRLPAIVREVRPDLVHAHHGYVALVATARRRIPTVVTYHGSDLLGRPRADGRVPPAQRLLARLCRFVSRFPDEVIVPNEHLAHLLRPRAVQVLPQEIDLETFAPVDQGTAREALGIPPRRRILLFASDPARPVKNFPFASRVFELVEPRFPDSELLVVHRESQERLALFLNAADVLLFPSWQEASPVVVKQAMACNLPVVASAVGDLPLLFEGVAGCHVRPLVESSFADAVVHELTLSRRTTARERTYPFRPGRIIPELLAVYEDAIARFAVRAESAAARASTHA